MTVEERELPVIAITIIQERTLTTGHLLRPKEASATLQGITEALLRGNGLLVITEAHPEADRQE